MVSTSSGIATAVSQSSTLEANIYTKKEVSPVSGAQKIKKMVLGNQVAFTTSTLQHKLAEGYRAMGTENSQLAEEFLPIEIEDWPDWDR